MSEILDRDRIFAASDLERELVEFPEWGGSFYVQAPTVAQKENIEIRAMKAQKDGKEDLLLGIKVDLAMLLCVNEEGERIFAKGDRAALSKKAAKPFQRIFDVAWKLGGWTKKDLDEMTGNLERTSSDSSVTG